MNRRKFLAALASAASVKPLQGFAASSDLSAVAQEAWAYCLPLIETARVRASRIAGINSLNHVRALTTPAFRVVTTPNVDTVYSFGCIDLGNGPATITLPPTGSRYFSLHLMDWYTNSFAVLGTRTTGSEGGTFAIVGPRDTAPERAIRSPTPWIGAIARVLVDGPEDMDAVHKIQDGIVLKASPARTPGSFATRDSTWSEYFSSAAKLLAENPPPATDEAL